ncbi:MAG: TolC family protein [Bacteroidota bacterium]
MLELILGGFYSNTPVFEEIDVVVSEEAFKPVTIDITFAINHALENRMEIRQQEISLEQASFDLIRTNAENEFKGTVSLSVGVFGDDRRFNEIYESPTNNPRVAVSFAIPLWDWGEKKARLASTKASIETNKIDLELEKTNIISSIRETYRQLINIQNQITISEQSVRNAELTYDINLERYRNGDLTSIDLNDFQKQLSQQRTNLANNRIDYKLTLLNLKIQSLWDFEKDQPILP